MAAPKKPTASAARATAPLTCASLSAWLAWLAEHHASSSGVWLRIAKKDGGQRSVTYAEAIEGALIWGWIDGQKNKLDDTHWLQRFSPRATRSPWSKINRDKATALIAAGKLQAPGLAEVERARRDGRWERAYDGARAATVPADLAAALAANAEARAAFRHARRQQSLRRALSRAGAEAGGDAGAQGSRAGGDAGARRDPPSAQVAEAEAEITA